MPYSNGKKMPYGKGTKLKTMNKKMKPMKLKKKTTGSKVRKTTR